MKLQTLRHVWQRWWLWLIALGIALPGLVLLAMQYRALRTLDETLPYYRRATMQRCISEVVNNLRRQYEEHAQTALALPAAALGLSPAGVLTSETQLRAFAQRAAAQFQPPPFAGARRYFLAVVTTQNGVPQDEVLFYDPASRAFARDPQAPELRAVQVASAPFLIYVRDGTRAQSVPFGVDRDAAHVLMLKAITNEQGRVLAVAGFELNLPWLQREAVPQWIRQALPLFFPNEQEDAVVTLHGYNNEVVYSTQPGYTAEPEAFLRLAPLFPRYALGMSMRGETVDQWARRSFYLNTALTLCMAAALAGGLALGLRAAAREVRLSRMKTDFVANVTHELRTPLTSILMLTELARTGRVKEADKLREFTEYIDAQSRRLLQLINNILDFSRMDGGLQQYQFAPTDVIEVVEQAIDACAGQFAAGGHTVLFEPPTAPLPLLPLDAAAMTRAVTNLLDNAAKYSGEAREIEVRILRHEHEIAIAVRDHGIGIARDEQARIFEKFYRVGTGLVHDVKGSGLGLTIVQHIVAAHRGRVTVESEPGRGSTFTIHLPFVVPASAGSARG